MSFKIVALKIDRLCLSAQAMGCEGRSRARDDEYPRAIGSVIGR